MSQHIIILAAGRSTRMGDQHKLLLPLGGVPMVRHVVEMATTLEASLILVTGHNAAHVEAALNGLSCTIIYNADYADGMSTSLQAGIRALPEGAKHALILLGDMPLITSAHCETLLSHAAESPECVIRASDQGQAGNPVVLPSILFQPIAGLSGDVGAQSLIKKLGLKTKLIDIGEAALMDTDTPEAYEALSARF